MRLGQYDEAEGLLRSSVNIVERAFGPRDARLIGPLSSLGILREERGDYREAEALQRRALAIGRARLGNENTDVMSMLGNLAELLQDEGKFTEAEKLMRQELEFDRKRVGNDQPDVAFDLNNLGRLMLVTGNFRASEPLLRAAVDILRRKNNPYLFAVMGNLGELTTKEGNPAGAEPMLAEALAYGLRTVGEQSSDVARVRIKYAACLVRLNKYPAAEEQLLAAWPVVEGSLGSQNPITRQAIRMLIDLYRAWGKQDRARAWESRRKRSAAAVW